MRVEMRTLTTLKFLNVSLRPSFLVLILALLGAGFVPVRAADANYAYRSAAFTRLIDESGKYTGSNAAYTFYAWFERAYASTPGVQPSELRGLPLIRALERRRLRIAALKGQAREQLEISTAAWLHRTIKTLIPTFSLDRGFEFSYTVSRGERQCLLQSVLIAGLLQRMGVNAGVAMVWRNPAGSESNLGHAATLIRFPDKDILVDASEPEPFPTHQGLFVLNAATGLYNFVLPTYAKDASITAYAMPEGPALAVGSVRGLDYNFVRSQFFFYRGERATDGFLGKPGTPEGLAASARALETAIKIQPSNPLAVYVLGHVYRRLGKADEARTQYAQGYRLYQSFGYVPAGAKTAYSDYVEK